MSSRFIVLIAAAMILAVPATRAEPRIQKCSSKLGHKALVECLLQDKLESEASAQRFLSAKDDLCGVAGECKDLDSGVDWVTREAYLGSSEVKTLEKRFRKNTEKFLKALDENDVNYELNSTRRSPERAWIMRLSYDLCVGKVSPDFVSCSNLTSNSGRSDCLECAQKACQQVKKLYENRGANIVKELADICDIGRKIPVNTVWHRAAPNDVVATACDMVKAFDVAFRPSLNSRHFPGLAFDITIARLPNRLKVNSSCAKVLRRKFVVTPHSALLLCYLNKAKEIACPDPDSLTEKERALLAKKWGANSIITGGLVQSDGVYIESADDAALNPAMWWFGESCFKVKKFVDDFPHWSDNGR